jgi:hypothetical protein
MSGYADPDHWRVPTSVVYRILHRNAYGTGIRSRRAIKVTKKTNISSFEELVVLLVLGLQGFIEEQVAFFFLGKIWFFPIIRIYFLLSTTKLNFFPTVSFPIFGSSKTWGLHPNSEKCLDTDPDSMKKTASQAWINCLNLPAHYKYAFATYLGLFQCGHNKMSKSILEPAPCHTVLTEKLKTV